MARHTAPRSPRRALLQAGLTVTAVGAALSAGAGAAQAAPAATPAALAVAPVTLPLPGVDQSLDEVGATPGQALTGALQHAAAGGIAPAKSMRLNPLAGTSVDPLDNTVGTQIADFQPVNTAAATAPLAKGAGLKDLPVVGTVTGALPG
ncbi:hypothetical protein ACH4SP_22820 [Streptomyces sp. NPDC021093]|uniref:hypothetical protein n=1 Tax=Streptomyces sp. NPDC021093 TaxID=3365112 RepID=UPI00378F8210